jgi:hypothetical protein
VAPTPAAALASAIVSQSTDGRRVTLVVLDAEGRALGVLPPYDVAGWWWMATDDIVVGARALFAVEVTVLRLLRAERSRMPGGAVAYAVRVEGEPPLAPVPADLRELAETDHPLRMAYARPDGTQATLAWARSALAARGRGPVAAAEQQRTWNLSAIWRLATPGHPVWIKEVPPFFGHEPAVLAWLAAHGHPAPPLIASDGRRMLLEHVEGADLYESGPDVRLAIAADMHAIQAKANIDDLLRLGVPDRRDLLARLAAVAGDLAPRLPERLERIADCGLPATLVHGDLHPGNVLGTPDGRRVILDWGDSVIGHPGLDILRLTSTLPTTEAVAVRAEWARWWRDAVPGCQPEQAVALLGPIAELYYASIYADLLANIEPSERPYHVDDVPEHVARAAQLLNGENQA